MTEPRDYFVHPSSYVDDGAQVGAGTKIWHFCHVLGSARIGKGCGLGQNVYVGKAVLGDGVRVQNNVSIYDGVVIEDHVFCGPSMVFTNVVNPRAEVSRKDEYKPTLIKRGATLGANSTIVCGATLGEYCFVAAGAVVRGDVAAYSLMMGVPARRAGWVCKCGVRLAAAADLGAGEKVTCAACDAKYVEKGGLLTAA